MPKTMSIGAASKKLEKIGQKILGKTLRKAVNAAASQVLKAAKSSVPVQSGLLKKSLGKKVRLYKGGTVAVALIGPRTGFKKIVVIAAGKGAVASTKKGQKLLAQGGRTYTRNPARYAHLVEKKRPFLRPAMASSKDAASGAMAQIVGPEVLKAASG